MSCCVYDDAPAFESARWPVARIAHQCSECGAKIQPKDKYQYISGLFDGDFYQAKTCEQCADLRDSLRQVWCTYLGNLRDDYQEFCDETGMFKWSDDGEKIIYPNNHLGLN